MVLDRKLGDNRAKQFRQITSFNELLRIEFHFLSSNLGINRRPTTINYYESKKLEIRQLLNRIQFIAFLVFGTYLVFGVFTTIGYLIMGNYDPTTWIVIYDQFL